MATSAVMVTTNQLFGDNEMKGDILYQDDQCMVFDVEEDRQAPVHFKVVPKREIRRSSRNADDVKLIGHLLKVAQDLAADKGLNGTGHHLLLAENPRNGRLRALHVCGRALHHMLWPTGAWTHL